MQLVPVILCDGAGSRPSSVTHESPLRQFIRLADGYSLLQKNILRAAKLPGVQKLVSVVNRDMFHTIKKEFEEINLTNQTMSFILEPFPRDTAAAITAAAVHIAQVHNEDTLILVLGVNHLNTSQDSFQHAISVGTESALAGKLVTFGMQSYATNTKYNYPRSNDTSLFLWNSSLFLFKAGTLLQAMKEHRPDILSATLTCLNYSELTEENSSLLRLELNPTSFFSIPASSINEEVIKKSTKTIVVPCDLTWLDSSLYCPPAQT